MTEKQTRMISALLTSPTREAAAKAAGTSTSTLRVWLKEDEEFKTAYKLMLDDLLSAAAETARLNLNGAIETIVDIMLHSKNDQARLTAARNLVDYIISLNRLTQSDIDTRQAKRQDLFADIILGGFCDPDD